MNPLFSNHFEVEFKQIFYSKKLNAVCFPEIIKRIFPVSSESFHLFEKEIFEIFMQREDFFHES